MRYTPTAKDRQVLEALVDYRQLTTSQIAALGSIGAPAARKRVRALREAGLVQNGPRPLHGRTGRPEELMTLSRGGIALLQETGGISIPPGSRPEQPVRCTDHQHLLNWFRIQLAVGERSIPGLASEFTTLEPQSDRQGRESGSSTREGGTRSVGGGDVEFVPDGVFFLRHQAERTALLFFLEVDMGTESLVGRSHHHRAFIAKIRNYQMFFRGGAYKRYEALWKQRFNGFRLLVLTSTPGRRHALGRLVGKAPPSDFIWLSDSEQLFSAGAFAPIWSRGGSDKQGESILGAKLAT